MHLSDLLPWQSRHQRGAGRSELGQLGWSWMRRRELTLRVAKTTRPVPWMKMKCGASEWDWSLGDKHPFFLDLASLPCRADSGVVVEVKLTALAALQVGCCIQQPSASMQSRMHMGFQLKCQWRRHPTLRRRLVMKARSWGVQKAPGVSTSPFTPRARTCACTWVA